MHPEQLKELIVTGIKEELKELFSQLTPTKKEDKLLTIKEVCKMLQCSKTTLWHWENKELLLPVRIGRNVRYHKCDVEIFINSKKH